MIIVIGRGHSGTRVISQLLYHNGYKTGQVNKSYDLIPPEEMYCAAKLFGERVKSVGDYEWDFKVGNVTPLFQKLVKMYLRQLIRHDGPKYFKLPETTLCYPWMVKMFPNAKFIHWIRDPRDFGWHLTDNFSRWRMPVPHRLVKQWTDQGVKSDRVHAAVSCKYQWDIVENSPRPKHFIRIRYEDFCTKQPQELGRLREFLQADLSPVAVRTSSIGKWEKDEEHFEFPFWKSMLARGGYF